MPLVPASPCPNCHQTLDGATGVGDSGPDDALSPDPGDFTVCIYCRHICVYDGDLRLRHPTSEEVGEIAGNPTLLAIMRAMKAAFP